MNFKNTSENYGLIAILLHWVLAVAVIGMFAVGLYMVELDYYDPLRKDLPEWHKSVGILLAGLFIFRFVWKMINPKPKPEGHVKWELTLAKITHSIMYLLVAIIVISGYLISTADGRSIDVFGWFSVPAIVSDIENQEDIAGNVHYFVACGLIILVMLHVAGALKHHFVDKDRTLKRMLGLSSPSKQDQPE